MAEIDVAKLKYKICIVTQSGEKLNVTDYVTACNWSDAANEVAARASITFANIKTDKGLLSSLIKLCTLVYIYADGDEVFRGVAWEWEYTSAANKELTITAYDKMIYATQSKDSWYYTAGQSTSTIVSDVCSRWGISLSFEWSASYAHAKTPIKGKTVSEEILYFLEEAAQKTSKYTAYMDKDTFYVKDRGQNSDVWILTAKNSISLRNKLSLSKLVTQVLVLGKEPKEGRPPVETTVQGDLQYGTLQEIVQRDSSQSTADAKAEAEKLIKERGEPEETITLQAPDVPFIRRGDKVKVNAGNIDKYLYVKSISHDAKAKKMTVELEK